VPQWQKASDVNKTFFQDQDVFFKTKTHTKTLKKSSRQDQDQDLALQDQDQDLSGQDETKITKTFTDEITEISMFTP
jgi:hypothetical protein